jgi:hypothetical protein
MVNVLMAIPPNIARLPAPAADQHPMWHRPTQDNPENNIAVIAYL